MDRLKFIFVLILFSTVGVFVKKIDLASGKIAFTRAIIGFIFLVILALFTNKKIFINQILNNKLKIIFSGFLLGLNWLFLFQSYKYTTLSIATISCYCAPIFMLILSILFLKEKPDIKKIICIFISIIGMILIFYNTNNSSSAFNYNHSLGILYGILTAICYSIVIIINKSLKGIYSLEQTLGQFFSSTVLLLIYILIFEDFNFNGLDQISAINLIIIGVVHTGFAFFVYFSSIKNISGQSVAILSYITPIFAVLISIFYLKEPINTLQVSGGILILASTFISEKKNKTIY
ncbi:DMT family transporter [Fusobacterium sp. MFO224]|uniref:DMT family transporter n=1 Tax=Fusobacterium sp. MFO224 TaxID=3378070 RepID=UPI003853D73D